MADTPGVNELARSKVQSLERGNPEGLVDFAHLSVRDFRKNDMREIVLIVVASPGARRTWRATHLARNQPSGGHETFAETVSDHRSPRTRRLRGEL
jgi:hypothetical protein